MIYTFTGYRNSEDQSNFHSTINYQVLANHQKVAFSINERLTENISDGELYR